jgi:hypothetical protein
MNATAERKHTLVKVAPGDYMRLKGRAGCGAGCGSPKKLTTGAVAEIRAGLNLGRTQVEIAREHGVDPSLISQIKRRVVWAHVEAVA